MVSVKAFDSSAVSVCTSPVLEVQGDAFCPLGYQAQSESHTLGRFGDPVVRLGSGNDEEEEEGARPLLSVAVSVHCQRRPDWGLYVVDVPETVELGVLLSTSCFAVSYWLPV